MTRFVNVGSNDQHALFCGFIVTIATILRTPCVGHDVIALGGCNLSLVGRFSCPPGANQPTNGGGK
jgi:hypothetical protein